MTLGPSRRVSALLSISLALASMQASAATASAEAQPWRNAAQGPNVRAGQLLKAMSQDQKIALVSGIAAADFASLAPLGIPALARVDASAGLRGDTGVTAFPVPLALAASFDVSLASRYGAAIATEARGKGWNVILGPTVDVARDGLSGRLTESFGEDPLVNGAMGAAVTKAMQAQGVLAVGKHFTAYTGERDRTQVNVVVSERTLHEVYNLPFSYLIEQGGIGALMGSYPKINGKYLLETPGLISMVKDGGKFQGFMMSDFMGGADGVAQFNAGIDSWSLQPFLRQPAAFKDGRIAAARLDDAVRRTLWALFSSGAYDKPVQTTADAIVTGPAHQALARRVAEGATVLLKNDGGVLPLKRSGQIAVIGPAGKDALTGVMWSTYVDPGQFTTPLEAIAASAGKARVVHAQGSAGDVVLPSFGLNDSPFAGPVPLATPGGAPGWQVAYFGSDDFSGTALRSETVKDIDIAGKPSLSMPATWSARWSADYTPDHTGLLRLAVSLSGTARVLVDGKVVIDGMRSTASNFPGGGLHTYPLQGTVMLTAGQKARIDVEYSTRGGIMGSRIQLGWQGRSMIDGAVELARRSDVAVVFVNQVTGEEMDRDDYALPADQNALIEAVSSANPNTVVVLNTGGAVKMPWLAKVKGVVQMWYPGAATGTAIASVLFGDADPGGRLPVSFLGDESQGPRPYKGGGEINYVEGADIGYRYLHQHDQKPLFAFGHGLSYTTFSMDRLAIAPLAAGAAQAAVTVRVQNTGARAGSAVVQLYSGALPASVATPGIKLVGFAKVFLPKGGAKTVTIPVARRMLSYWDEESAGWITPPGRVRLGAGFSSARMELNGELTVQK